MAIDGAGNLIMLGSTTSVGEGSSDVLISKYNSSGTILWQRILGGVGNDRGESVSINSNNEIIISGYTNSEGNGDYNALLAKYDSNGTLLWQRTLGGSSYTYCFSSTIIDNNIIISGYVDLEGTGNYDICVAKYDTLGTILWQRILAGTGSDYGSWVKADSNGDIVLTGYTSSVSGVTSDAIFAKIPNDNTGTPITSLFSYEQSNLVSLAATLVDSAVTIPEDTINLSINDSNLTSSSVNFSQTVYKIVI